ncbi:NnrS [Oceaniovalibus guishaninsula JLT2003]|uniref:NnrS n=1 Tax=Oceaniovalibus guishaninsula JLT2003 TaxID=1231392 RepID=K2HQI8_9RHOB|nr:NnrS family protein [Oceaniovalibus guishaninsula]EKE45064.1 NnrS [Oceaniovalibus guishaninsula JLT2003]
MKAQGTAALSRAWTGPALLSFGFRPFFLLSAAWAALAMAVWIVMLAGRLDPPPHFDPISWHAHEFLFGYLGGVVAGFLLTAVPNWTGRLPVVGWNLGLLALLWLAGRAAVAGAFDLSLPAVAVVDLAFPLILGGVILREIVAGKNWRNLPVLALLTVFAIANGIFYCEAAMGQFAAQGYGLRLGLATGLVMIALIGGRIVPSFTRNWLVKRGSDRLPVPPMQRFDKIVLLVTIAALLLWVLLPHERSTAAALLLLGVLHAARLSRWQGRATLAEPLLTILHIGYAFVPLGAVAMAAAIWWPQFAGEAAAQHLWMAGGIGTMTLAVMTRATLGHSGRDLHAGPGTVAIYGALIVAVIARVAAPGFLEFQVSLHIVAGLAWIASFGGFALLYGPLLLLPKEG